MRNANREIKVGNGVRREGEKGFSLVEVLVAIAMVSIFLAAAMAVLTTLTRSYTATEVTSDAQQVVRMAVEVMANDIRLAGLDPLGTAGAGMKEASATSIRFTCDRVAEGDSEASGYIENDNFENIQYYYEAATRSLNLRLYSGAPVQTTQQLVNNVTNLRFRYFDQDGSETSTLSAIRSVQISMTVREDAGTEGPIERSYSTRVLCRNLGV